MELLIYPVTEALRTRVLAAAEELHYVPNAAAQGLLRGRSGSVGVLVGDVADPFFSAIISGVHAYADEIDHLVSIINTYRQPESELRAVRRLHAHRVDVRIVAGSGLEDQAYVGGLTTGLAAFLREGGAVTLVGRHRLLADLAVSSVTADNRAGAALMAEHLSTSGHRTLPSSPAIDGWHRPRTVSPDFVTCWVTV